jgi:Transposase DDE domain
VLTAEKGAKEQAIGLSRGGQTTKIHTLSDTLGRPIVFKVTAGNMADIKMAAALLAEVEDCRHVLADKGYDSGALRTLIRDKGQSRSSQEDGRASAKFATTRNGIVSDDGGGCVLPAEGFSSRRHPIRQTL